MPCASGSLYGGATQECNSCLCGPTSSVCVKSLRGKNVRIGGKRYTYLGHEFSVAGGLPTTTWEHWQAKLSGKSMDGHQRRKRLTEMYYASIVHKICILHINLGWGVFGPSCTAPLSACRDCPVQPTASWKSIMDPRSGFGMASLHSGAGAFTHIRRICAI